MKSQDIVDGLNDQLYSDGNVNYIQLNEGLEFISKYAKTILSILTAVLLIGIQLVIAMEIVYINFPVFQSKMNDVIIQGKGKFSKVLAFTLRDAQRAINIATTEDKNANLEYLRIKLKTVFVVMFVVALAFGGGSWLINFVAKLLSGPLDIVKNALI